MTGTLFGDTAGEVLRAVFEERPDTLFVVNPGAGVVGEYVETAIAFDDPLPETRLIASDRLLKDVTDRFLVASNAADLVADGDLALRTAADLQRTSVLVTAERVVAFVDAGGRTGGLTTTDDAFVAAARDSVAEDWARAEEFALRTPPLSRVRRTLDAEIGSAVARDFDDVLTAADAAGDAIDDLDEVVVSLLVAARNRVLLYDISKWGEDVGVASKATFSRTKTTLEDVGLLDTEKVPIEVGRPRLRLKLADDALHEAPPDELVAAAVDALR